jgi:hypothetical protein
MDMKKGRLDDKKPQKALAYQPRITRIVADRVDLSGLICGMSGLIVRVAHAEEL